MWPEWATRYRTTSASSKRPPGLRPSTTTRPATRPTSEGLQLMLRKLATMRTTVGRASTAGMSLYMTRVQYPAYIEQRAFDVL